MDKYTATEMAYKHGYEKGYEAGKKFVTDNNDGCYAQQNAQNRNACDDGCHRALRLQVFER